MSVVDLEDENCLRDPHFNWNFNDELKGIHIKFKKLNQALEKIRKTGGS